MRHRPPKASRDAGKQIADIQFRNQGIGDLEQNLQTVAFARQLPLIFLGFLEVQSVVHRDGYLGSHLLHDVELFFGRGRGSGSESEHQCPQPVLGGGQRQPAGCDNVVAPQQFHHAGPARFDPDIGNHQWPLVQEHPSGRRFFGRQFQLRRFHPVSRGGFEDVQPHGVGSRVVQHQIQEIEAQNGAQPGGQVVKKPGQIAMLQDGFGDVE